MTPEIVVHGVSVAATISMRQEGPVIAVDTIGNLGIIATGTDTLMRPAEGTILGGVRIGRPADEVEERIFSDTFIRIRVGAMREVKGMAAIVFEEEIT